MDDQEFNEVLAAQVGKTPAESEPAPTEPRTRPEEDSPLRVLQDVLGEDNEPEFSVSSGLDVDRQEPRQEIWEVHDVGDRSKVDRVFEREEDAAAYLRETNRAADAELRVTEAHSTILRSNVERLVEDGYTVDDPPLQEAMVDFARTDPAAVSAYLEAMAEAEREELSEDLDNYDLTPEELRAELARIEAEPTEADRLRSVVEAQLVAERQYDTAAQIEAVQTKLSELETAKWYDVVEESLRARGVDNREEGWFRIAELEVLASAVSTPERAAALLGLDLANPADMQFANELSTPPVMLSPDSEEFGRAVERLSMIRDALAKQSTEARFHERLLNTPDGTISGGLEDSNSRLAKALEKEYEEDTKRLKIDLDALRNAKPRRALTKGQLRAEVAASPSLMDGLTSNGKKVSVHDVIAQAEGYVSSRDKHDREEAEARRRDMALWGR